MDMLLTEIVSVGGRNFRRTYSDSNKMIERDGVLYNEAIDPIEFDRFYHETDIEIEVIEED